MVVTVVGWFKRRWVELKGWRVVGWLAERKVAWLGDGGLEVAWKVDCL